MKYVIISAVLTAILASPVRNYAVAHHQQWNFSVVLLLFVAIYATMGMVRQFLLLWKCLEAYDDNGDVQ